MDPARSERMGTQIRNEVEEMPPMSERGAGRKSIWLKEERLKRNAWGAEGCAKTKLRNEAWWSTARSGAKTYPHLCGAIVC